MEPVIVKLGGALLADEVHMNDIWEGIKTLQESFPVVLVHGGGPQATAMARRMGHEPVIVSGRRVTTDLDLEIMQWVVRGTLNSSLVAKAWKHKIKAVGLSGADGGIIQVTKRPVRAMNGVDVDFGHVGDVQHVDTDTLRALLEVNILPVVAPLGVDSEGQLYNVNADTIAFEIARAMNASRFLFITEMGGVWKDVLSSDGPLSEVCPDIFALGMREGWINGGMQVKIKTALDAAENGVSNVFIAGPKHVNQPTSGTRIHHPVRKYG